MEIQIIVALSLMLLILLFGTWIDRHKRRKDEEHLIQKTLEPLQTQINQLEKLVRALLNNTQKQEINVLSDVARQADALAAEIFRLQLVRLGLANDNRLNVR